jgi:hypothetical protein
VRSHPLAGQGLDGVAAMEEWGDMRWRRCADSGGVPVWTQGGRVIDGSGEIPTSKRSVMGWSATPAEGWKGTRCGRRGSLVTVGEGGGGYPSDSVSGCTGREWF